MKRVKTQKFWEKKKGKKDWGFSSKSFELYFSNVECDTTDSAFSFDPIQSCFSLIFVLLLLFYMYTMYTVHHVLASQFINLFSFLFGESLSGKKLYEKTKFIDCIQTPDIFQLILNFFPKFFSFSFEKFSVDCWTIRVSHPFILSIISV